MGGRGASSGSSKAGNQYGSQYRTLAADGDMKLVVANATMSRGAFTRW